MSYTFLLGVALFIYAGVSDWKTRKIHDIVSIALWTVCLFGGANLYFLVTSFLIMWTLAEAGEINNIKIFGWGDILVVPPFLALLANLAGGTAYMTTGLPYQFATVMLCVILVVTQVWLYFQPKNKRKHAPLVFFMMLGMLGAGLGYLLSTSF